MQKLYTDGLSLNDAISIVEGYDSDVSESTYQEAWQLLINTGMCWRLGSWFERNAEAMIEAGICENGSYGGGN